MLLRETYSVSPPRGGRSKERATPLSPDPHTKPAAADDGPVSLPIAAPAVAHVRYAEREALEIEERRIETLPPGEVLVRVEATSINPADWYGVTGFLPARIGNGLRRPKDARVGIDLAGRVAAAGADVTAPRAGDAVFGTGAGAWATYATASVAKLARMPDGVSFADAAAVPVAGITALQAVRDHAGVRPGGRVLVNGASGGVGTFAVQLACWLGAEVTAVCSTPNVALMPSLGAHRVVDYTREDVCASAERYDAVIDVAGSLPLRRLCRVLERDARIVLVGAPMSSRGLGPLPHLVLSLASGRLRRRPTAFFVAKVNTADLDVLGRLVADGVVRPVVDRRYAGLDRIDDALRYLGQGHARGKVVVSL